jgi:Ca2+-transporting ATPase
VDDLISWPDVCRYFTGHTKNPDGSVQFQAGKTKVSDVVDDAVKIVTVAVCIYKYI